MVVARRIGNRMFTAFALALLGVVGFIMLFTVTYPPGAHWGGFGYFVGGVGALVAALGFYLGPSSAIE